MLRLDDACDIALPATLQQEREYRASWKDQAYSTVLVALRLVGARDVSNTLSAWLTVTHRHEILRSRFALADGEVLQVVQGGLEVTVRHIDLREFAPGVRGRVLHQFCDDLLDGGLSLSRAPLYRVGLLTVSSHEQLLCLAAAHAIVDASAHNALALAVLDCASVPQPDRAVDPPAPLQPADIAAWQRSQGSETPELAQLRGRTGAVALPVDRRMEKADLFRGAQCPLPRADRALTARLGHLGAQQGGTLASTLLAAVSCVVYAFDPRDEVVIGLQRANRGRGGLGRVVGCLTDIFPISISLRATLPFHRLVREVAPKLRAAYVSDVPGVMAVDALIAPPDITTNVAYDDAITLGGDSPGRVQCIPSRLCGREFLAPARSMWWGGQIDIEFRIGRSGGMTGLIFYNGTTLAAAWIAALSRYVGLVLGTVASDPSATLASVANLAQLR